MTESAFSEFPVERFVARRQRRGADNSAGAGARRRATRDFAQYRTRIWAKLHDLYDGSGGSYGGQRQPVRLLPQRIIHQPGHERRAREVPRPSQDDGRLRLLPYQHNDFRPTEEFASGIRAALSTNSASSFCGAVVSGVGGAMRNRKLLPIIKTNGAPHDT
jgi:hypothetical protein